MRDYGVDGQLGLEKTPEEFIENMLAVFREVWRVLTDNGTLWLNMGDSYAASGKGGANYPENAKKYKQGTNKGMLGKKAVNVPMPKNLKPKDLCGMPWRLAFALQADGWYLRQDIIWHKPNPMPESVRDRCTKAHEYIFLMTKKPRYYYDAGAIRENNVDPARVNYTPGKRAYAEGNTEQCNTDRTRRNDGFEKYAQGQTCNGRNKRSVWTVTIKPYEAHFATFPPDLIRPCILAGCPKQVCKKCGKPRVRVVDKGGLVPDNPSYKARGNNRGDGFVKNATTPAGEKQGHPNFHYENKTVGWTDCGCGAGFRPGIVLDPFMGSGTVAEVAAIENRDYVGCELNQEYIDLGRVQAVETGVPVKEARKGQKGLFE